MDAANRRAEAAPMSVYAERIRAKLSAEFAPVVLDIEDESSRHAGHAGAAPGGETHFRVRIVSAAFAGLGRVERQRRVYTVLASELAERVHALALETRTPDEAAKPARG
jgi:BolA family transcriptional regulator, general stress-responsive regulator